MNIVLIIIGTALVTSMLWMIFYEPEVDPLQFLLDNDIPEDSDLEKKLLTRFVDRATGIQDVLHFQSFIYDRAERGFCSIYQWHCLLWMIRRLGCCSEEHYILAVKTAQACTLLTEDELLFPPLAFSND